MNATALWVTFAVALATLLGWGVVLGEVSIVQAIIDVVVLGWLFWLTWEHSASWDRTDEAIDVADRALAASASDTADRALAAVQAIVNHLDETGPTTGRHALAAAQAMTKEQPL